MKEKEEREDETYARITLADRESTSRLLSLSGSVRGRRGTRSRAALGNFPELGLESDLHTNGPRGVESTCAGCYVH